MQAQTLTQTNDCAASPAPTICNLIQSVQSAKECARVEREQRVQEKIAEAHQAARDVLGALYDALTPLVIRAEHGTDSNGDFARLTYILNEDTLAQLELAPFKIVISERAAGKWSIHFVEIVPQGYSRLELSTENSARFLHAMHEKIMERRERERQANIAKWKTKLDPERYERARNETDADAALAALNQLDPSGAAEWNALHAKLLAKIAFERQHAEYKERKRAEREQAARRAGDEYATAFEAYERLRRETETRNGVLVQQTQAAFDETTLTACELVYGIAARDEEQGVIVETDSVWVQESAPTFGDTYHVFHHGTLEARTFFHPAYLRAPQTFKPSEAPSDLRQARTVRELGYLTFYASPGVDMQPALDALCITYRQPPTPPQWNSECLSDWDARRIATRVCELLDAGKSYSATESQSAARSANEVELPF